MSDPESGLRVKEDRGKRSAPLFSRRLPPCVVTTTDGWRVSGMLYMKNRRVVVLLNGLCEGAELGSISPLRVHQLDPEAEISVIPAEQVAEIEEYDVL